MKTIAIGDVHGRSLWKLIVNQEQDADRIVFIGDYFDSFDIKGEDQLNNFLDILEYKKSSGKEVILLIGNHDYHYFPEIGDTGTSGYQRIFKHQIEPTIDANREHLQMAYQFENILCTHAGVSSMFMDNVFGADGWDVETISDKLNELFKYKPMSFNFDGFNPYGDDEHQTPIWIRPRSLQSVNKKTLRKQVIQVVGHTAVTSIDIKGKSTGGRYYFIDCFDTSGEYLIFNDNKFEINKV